MTDIENPENWRTKGDVAQWIARQAGVPVDEVRAARKKADKARGHEWRGSDDLGHVRRRLLARLNSTPAPTSTRPTPTATARRVALDPAAQRAADMTGPLNV